MSYSGTFIVYDFKIILSNNKKIFFIDWLALNLQTSRDHHWSFLLPYLRLQYVSLLKYHLSCFPVCVCVCVEALHALRSWVYFKVYYSFCCPHDRDFPSIIFSEDDVFVIFFAYKKALNGFGKTQVKQVSLQRGFSQTPIN